MCANISFKFKTVCGSKKKIKKYKILKWLLVAIEIKEDLKINKKTIDNFHPVVDFYISLFLKK